jgi:hypothetical protein
MTVQPNDNTAPAKSPRYAGYAANEIVLYGGGTIRFPLLRCRSSNHYF